MVIIKVIMTIIIASCRNTTKNKRENPEREVKP